MDTLELGLAGKVAIVTGGSEGLGLACVERFARSGAKVAACARRKDVLERGVEQVRRATGGDILAMTADVTKGAEVEAFVKATLARFGGVDILVNNAGTSSAAGFDQVDEQHGPGAEPVVVGPHAVDADRRRALIHAPADDLVARVRGGAARLHDDPRVNREETAPAHRAGRVHLQDCLGLVKSAQHERRAKGDVEEYYKEISERRKLPLGRFGEASEFADLVAFLASERAAYITGTAVNFDGGISAAV